MALRLGILTSPKPICRLCPNKAELRVQTGSQTYNYCSRCVDEALREYELRMKGGAS